MGKNLIQQARGKGGPRYRSPGFRYLAEVKHKSYDNQTQINGSVIDIVRCPGHSAPLATIKYEDNKTDYIIAPEGLKIGDNINCGGQVANVGNVLELKYIPEGSLIYNIENIPGDGGKFVRASGTFAKIISKLENRVLVMLPSKKQKDFNPKCRAAIGVVSGGGRTDKPILKAGKKHLMMKARNKLWPIVGGTSMCAVDHPFGNTRSLRKSKARPAPKNAPPGRKVGMIRPRRTGRKKR